jgi:hypothetical protein
VSNWRTADHLRYLFQGFSTSARIVRREEFKSRDFSDLCQVFLELYVEEDLFYGARAKEIA